MDYSIYPVTIQYRILTKRLDFLRNCPKKYFKEVIKYVYYQESLFSRITKYDRVSLIKGYFEIAIELSKHTANKLEVVRLLRNVMFVNKGYSALAVAKVLTDEAFRLKSL